MVYEDVVRDFALRTQKNLDAIDRLRAKGSSEVYEVTQLINSTLELLIFPQQEYVDRIPRTPLSQLRDEGWPIPKVRPKFEQVSDLNELIRYLRNAVAHFNIRFLGDPDGNIDILEVWNERPIRDDRGKLKRDREGNLMQEVNWKATLSVDDLRRLTSRFVNLLLDESQPHNTYEAPGCQETH
jgi:hypothetical protein